MKYVKKCMAVFLVACMVSVGFSQSAYACDKTADCYSQNTTSTCGYVRGEQGFHVVTEPNGYTSYCTITVVSGPHTIRCAGCNAVLRTETRKCSETHSNKHCFSQNNLCK